ncbi:MAG: hypothetical protein WAV20_16105 [Blastocatellia bacterium]
MRPATMSARPRRMAAIIRNSSVISSSDALSGSLQSIEYCFLVGHRLMLSSRNLKDKTLRHRDNFLHEC